MISVTSKLMHCLAKSSGSFQSLGGMQFSSIEFNWGVRQTTNPNLKGEKRATMKSKLVHDFPKNVRSQRQLSLLSAQIKFSVLENIETQQFPYESHDNARYSR